MSSSSDPPSGGSPDTYGSSERSEELEVGIQQLGFSQTPEKGQLAQELTVWQGGQDAQKLPPIPTVEANEVGEPGPSGLKGKALADVTSTLNVMRLSSKKRTTASQDDVQALGNRLEKAIDQSADKICGTLEKAIDQSADKICGTLEKAIEQSADKICGALGPRLGHSAMDTAPWAQRLGTLDTAPWP
eukprot:scaffold19387_cov64-Phaeocystis_antarctica.AAC.1